VRSHLGRVGLVEREVAQAGGGELRLRRAAQRRVRVRVRRVGDDGHEPLDRAPLAHHRPAAAVDRDVGERLGRVRHEELAHALRERVLERPYTAQVHDGLALARVGVAGLGRHAAARVVGQPGGGGPGGGERHRLQPLADVPGLGGGQRHVQDEVVDLRQRGLEERGLPLLLGLRRHARSKQRLRRAAHALLHERSDEVVVGGMSFGGMSFSSEASSIGGLPVRLLRSRLLTGPARGQSLLPLLVLGGHHAQPVHELLLHRLVVRPALPALLLISLH
jgi:hypothetical protein